MLSAPFNHLNHMRTFSVPSGKSGAFLLRPPHPVIARYEESSAGRAARF
jgi:hypothetical protein